MNHKINLTETYTTRDGRPARVLCVNADAEGTVVALVDGRAFMFTNRGNSEYGQHFDLIPAPKTHKVVVWVNVDNNGETASHATKEGADFYAAGFMRNRIACIHIEATAQEGQYDE